MKNGSDDKRRKEIQVGIGYVYHKIEDTKAIWDLSRTRKKIHDWTIFVQFDSEEDADKIEKVTFTLPSFKLYGEDVTYHCNCPVSKMISNGEEKNNRHDNDTTTKQTMKWRFSSRHITYGKNQTRKFVVAIKILRGKVVKYQELKIKFVEEGEVILKCCRICVSNSHVAFNAPVKQLDNKETKLSAELEFFVTAPTHDGPYKKNDIKDLLKYSIQKKDKRIQINFYDVDVDENRDKSLLLHHKHITNADCWGATFILNDDSVIQYQLISPMCEVGLLMNNLVHVLTGIQTMDGFQVHPDSKMGLFIHVDVSTFHFEGIKNMCLNYVKYEKVMDNFMPPKRRLLSDYCKSNSAAICHDDLCPLEMITNKERHLKISSCKNEMELFNTMHPTSSVKVGEYKFNLFVSNETKLISIRHHHMITDKVRAKLWIRFCYAFVLNSAKYSTRRNLAESTCDERAYKQLFMYVIKDRYIRDYAKKWSVQGDSHNKHTEEEIKKRKR